MVYDVEACAQDYYIDDAGLISGASTKMSCFNAFIAAKTSLRRKAANIFSFIAERVEVSG